MTEKSAKQLSWVFRAFIAMIILLAGVITFKVLAAKKPQIEIQSRPQKKLRVQTQNLSIQDHQIFLKSFAQIRSPKELTVNAEISAKVIWLSPKLHVGEIFKKDELLFQLDPTDFKIQLAIAQSQLDSEIANQKMLETELASFKTILPARIEKLALSTKEYQLNKKLLQEELSTDTQVIAKQQIYLLDFERVEEQKKLIETLKSRINISKSRQKELKKSITLSQRNLARCDIRAPEKLRLSKKSITLGQFISQGQNCLTLVDDNQLETVASLNGPEALSRLQTHQSQSSLSSRLIQQKVAVKWQSKTWQGTISGIEEYNSQTRSLQLVIRLEKTASSQLLPGLFCEVIIPAKQISKALKIPYFSYQDGKIRIIENGLLSYTRAKLLFDDGDHLYVRPEKQANSWQVITENMNNAVTGTAVKEMTLSH